MLAVEGSGARAILRHSEVAGSEIVVKGCKEQEQEHHARAAVITF